MRSSSQSGFAMPMVLLTMVLLTVGLVSLLQMVGSDRRVPDNQSAQVKAFTLAQSGLEHFLAKRDSLSVWVADSNKWILASSMLRPARSESLSVALTGGYADVVMRQVRVGTQMRPSVFAVRSRGVSLASRLRGLPQAERTVAQYAYWQVSPMHVAAGWTSVSGLTKTGATGVLSGTDACGAEPTVAGVAVGNPGYTQTGNPPVPSGSPAIQNLGTPQDAYTATRIDWPAIINQNAIVPDITIPPQTWPSFANPNYWPVIKVVGNASLPGNGRGLLIVTGNLTMSGASRWDGIVMVGGNLTSNGNNTVAGATITGLNVGLGQVVPMNSLGNGDKAFQYNSCNVARASQRWAMLRTYPNAWLDNWASY
jgi:hypothetical protein